MDQLPDSLSLFFASHRERGAPLVLATLIETIGSTYRKAGAQMLIGADGQAAGLLSGGCLESDLRMRAEAVVANGSPAIAEYDTRSSDDIIWGIGLGCEGAMRILLTKLDVVNSYQPFAFVEDSRREHRPAAFAIVTESTNPAYPLGTAYWGSSTKPRPPAAVDEAIARLIPRGVREGTSVVTSAGAKFLAVRVQLPVKLLVLGAGVDAQPLVAVAGLLGWDITVYDHRAAYAAAEHFPQARNVMVSAAAELSNRVAVNDFDAAVVMSHHLPSDQTYLSQLAKSSIAYVGLLGPAARRHRLFAEIGAEAASLHGRLRGPVGLDIGAKSPESIALSIVSEIHAALSGRSGRPFSIVTGE